MVILDAEFLVPAVRAAGIGQLAIVAISFGVPRALRWGEDLLSLRPLNRQVFFTYAGYIFVTNLCLGLLSTIAPHLLVEKTTLAMLVCSYITAYWGARFLIQIFYFDRSDAPKGPLYKFADIALTAGFLGLTAIYGLCIARQLG